MRRLATGVCAVLALAACGSPAQPDAARTPGATTTTPAPSSGPPEDQPAEPVAPGGLDESAAEGDGPPVTLVDVRLGVHEGFDRIVFELTGDGRPGWQIGFTGSPRSQRSGEPVEVPGHTVLGLTLTNIALPGDAPAGVRPWSGPDRRAADEAAVLDALVTGTLVEGRYSFFAGLDQQRPFAVGQLTSPQRIVVDLLEEEPESATELSQRCENPAGFVISYPEGWAVNSGATVPECSRFAPESFTVPPGTDARVGSVTASVEDIPFDVRASPQASGPGSRTDTRVDGRPAVRIERVTAGQGLYPPGIRMTTYLVDLESGDGGRGTLVVDTVGLPQFDYARNVRLLDRMIRTLEFTDGRRSGG